MIATYDFVFMAKRDKDLMRQLEEALLSEKNCIVYTDIHKLYFDSEKQTVTIISKSETSDFRWKIIPKEIKYEALRKMLDGDW